MLKGSRRQMIVVRTGRSRYFDSAYFVLRREVDSGREESGDILREANRILEESTPERRRGYRRWGGGLLFLAGTLCGGGCGAVLCLLL